LGALLGTLVLPGVGSLIGGVLGTIVATASAEVGGTLGFAIIGMISGKWIGKRFKPKDEKRYELTVSVERKIAKRCGVDSKTALAINSYLYNRAKSVGKGQYKDFFKKLRKKGVKQAEPEAMRLIALFFANELKTLTGFEKEAKEDKARSQEIAVVKAILTGLSKSQLKSDKKQDKGKSERMANEVALIKKVAEKALDTYEQQINARSKEASVKPPKKTHKKPARLTWASKQPRKKFLGVHRQSNKPLPANEVKSALSKPFANELANTDLSMEIGEAGQKDDLTYHCRVLADGQHRGVITFEQKAKKKDVASSGFYLNKESLSQKDEVLLKVLALQAKAYYESIEQREVRIVAAGDMHFAAKLVAASKMVGLDSKLDGREFNEEKRAKIEKMAGNIISTQAPKEQGPRVGFGFTER